MEKAWSYSALDSFETCPKKHWHTRVFKDFIEPEGVALRWGKKVHKAFELRIKDGAALPPELMGYEKLMQRFAAQAEGALVTTEEQIAVTRDFCKVTWFGKDVWLRAVIDLCIIKGTRAVIVDWKTGKPSDNFDQLELAAALLMTMQPQIKITTCAFVWTKVGQVSYRTFKQAGVPALWQGYIERLTVFNGAFAQNHWPAKPNSLCKRWCPVTICQHNGTSH